MIVLAISLTHEEEPWRSTRVGFFFAVVAMHFIVAIALGLLAGKLGKGEVSVGVAAFISTPLLLPISYVRVVWWARKALTNSARKAMIGNDVDIDTVPTVRLTGRDRL
jgi:threonine/homoserine efflux transporter RhtA